MATELNKYNKEPKDAQNLALVKMDQELMDVSKKTPERSDREYTKVESDYIRDLTYFMLRYTKGGAGNNTKYRK